MRERPSNAGFRFRGVRKVWNVNQERRGMEMTKLMMAGLLVLVAAGVTLPVRGDTLCAGESAQVAIDLTPGTRQTSGTETIPTLGSIVQNG